MRLKTLGGLVLEGAAFRRKKPLLLLAYLTLEGPRSRRQLVDLFWPFAADGRDSLQTTLRRLRQVGTGLVEANGDRVAATVTCDASEFEEAERNDDYASAVRLYVGAFLDGVDLPLHAEVEEWLYVTRERLAMQARSCHLRLAESALRHRDRSAARNHAENGFALPGCPPWTGAELERLLWVLETTESPRAEEARRELAELGETEHLPSRRRRSLPSYGSTFVGREAELTLIDEQLSSPHVRMLTIHGPGGVGKTRLAVETAYLQTTAERFPHGVYYVPMETVPDGAAAVEAIADALRLSLAAPTPPTEQVLEAIGERKLMLVLDNFEHLVGATTLPADILRACPNAKVVVTSRRVMNLAEEHVLALGGLETSSATGDPAAVKLLVDRLARHAIGKEFGHEDEAAATRVCQTLDGNPLAIELAAASARYLTLEDLAEDLLVGGEALVNRDPTAPSRHRSLDETLRVTWDLLDGPQQAALAALANFSGGFDREAAAAVANLDAAMIESLVDFALVRMLPSGRFEQHALVRQFISGRLSERPDLEQSSRQRHARYYLSRLADLGHAVLGGDTTNDALRWIEVELPNIERAWSRATEAGEPPLLEGAVWTLAHMGELTGRYRESIKLITSASDALAAEPSGGRALGRLLGCLSFLYFRVGEIEKSILAGERAAEILEPLREPVGNWGLWSAYQGMAMSNLSRSDVAAARRYLMAGIELSEKDRANSSTDEAAARNADIATGISVQTLAFLAIAAGEHGEGIALLERATESFEPHKAPYLSYVYWQLGRVHLEMGAVERARNWLERGLDFSQEIGFTTLVGHTLDNMARVKLRLGETQAALDACERALPRARESGDKWLQSRLLAAKGMAFKALGDLWGAREAFRESLEIARSFNGLGFAMESFVGLADPAYHGDRPDRSVAILSCVSASTLSPEIVAREAREHMDQLAGVLSKESLATASERGRSMSLEEAFAIAYEAQLPATSGVRQADRAGARIQPN